MEELFIVGSTAVAGGAALGLLYSSYRYKDKYSQVEAKMQALLLTKEQILEAEKSKELLELKAEIYKKKQEWENNFDEERKSLNEMANKQNIVSERLACKQEELLQQEREILFLEKNVTSRERKSLLLDQELEKSLARLTEQLESLASFSKEDAKELLLNIVRENSTMEIAKTIRAVEEDLKENIKKKAQEMIAIAIQRYASEYVSAQTTSTITLPSEDMKGRIIGREGRNIRAIEAATGVDIIIDDTPEVITISSFSPLRRQIAYTAIESLLADGRIHPARIEEVVKRSEDEIEDKIKELGEQAAFDTGVYGLSPELIRTLGLLHFRTSYSQNVLQHSIEVAFIAGMLAAELGMNVKLAKRAGLLHDIGKAVKHEVEGPHALIGGDLAKKFGEDSVIVEAIASHHEDIPITSSLAILIQAADSISGARPGARKEILENYISRLEDLEEIALAFTGVVKAYAIQAGREIRVIVDTEIIDDDTSLLLSREIAQKIETDLMYPGQVRVVVIREKRALAIAK